LTDFETLTKLGRARRLRGLAERALLEYDIDVARIRLVNNISNCTFRIDAADGCSYAMRVNLPGMRTADEIRSELVWQEAIYRDTDIPVPLPIRTCTGDLVAVVESRGVPEPRVCNLSTWVRGRTLSRSATPESFSKLGELSAGMHAHGAGFEPPPGFSVPRLDSLFPAGMPDRLFTDDGAWELSRDTRKLMTQVREALADELGRLYKSGARPQIVHGDLHWWNVLVDRGKLQPIDFEDCALAFPVQDIAITFYYLLGDPGFAGLVEAFRAGYAQRRPWPEEYPGQIELLTGHRALELVNLLLNSKYQEDLELLPEFIEIVDRDYRPLFERWRSRR
jgi:Ser/Thr protein kinase RdoA (MazF antagonist)